MMPGTSPILGLPMADQDADFVTDFPDAVDIPRTTGLEKFTVPRFTSITDRNTRIPTPVDGQMCYLSDTGTLQQHNGFVWVGDTAAVNVTGTNGWNAVNFKYRMDHRGVVTLMGDMDATNATTAVIGVLPIYHRPAFGVFAVGSAYIAFPTYMQTALLVRPSNGEISVHVPSGQNITAALDGYGTIVFQANFKAVR